MSGSKRRAVAATMAAAILISGAGCVGPAQPVTTVWQKMGIPQTFLGLRDHFTNRKGNFPQCERKPPMLRIADPANLESPNAAIKAAAEVKAEEDLAPQKIKALKYLAEIGCGCYDEDGKVKDAILAGLADCTPAVRMAALQLVEATLGMCDDEELTNERRHCLNCGDQGCQLCQSERHQQRKDKKALKALQKTKKHEHQHRLKNLLCRRCNGNGCEECQCCMCNSAGCCGKEVQEKLRDMAYGMDDYGCHKEPVPAIREAAASLLEMCPCIPDDVKPETPPSVDPESGDEAPPEGSEGNATENDTVRQPNPATGNTPLPLGGLPTGGTARPAVGTTNTGYLPPIMSAQTAPGADGLPASSRRSSGEFDSQTIDQTQNMVLGALESIDNGNRRMTVIFSDELMIPIGELLLMQIGDGEAQCRIIQSVPGRVQAEIIGYDYTRTPISGEAIRFGVLAQ